MTTTTTRAEHLEWCKQRALEYIKRGDTIGAWASMVSDMRKNEDTANHVALELGMMLLVVGQLSTPSEMQKFIEGFN